jgi:hypothetical protein
MMLCHVHIGTYRISGLPMLVSTLNLKGPTLCSADKQLRDETMALPMGKVWK